MGVIDPIVALFGAALVVVLAAVVFGRRFWRRRLFPLLPVAYDRAVHSLADGVIILDAERNIVDMNPAARRFLGHDDGPVGGCGVEALLTAEQARPLERLYQSGAQQRWEFTLTHGEQTRYLEVSASLLSRKQAIAGSVLTLRDVSARREIEAGLNERLMQQAAIRRIDAELTRKLNVDYVVTMALDNLMRISQADSGAILFPDDDDGRLQIKHAIGYDAFQLNTMRAQPNTGIVGRVSRTQEATLTLNVIDDPDYVPTVPETRAQITIPLLSQDRLVGVLVLETVDPKRFSAERFEFLQAITSRIAAALDNANLYRLSQRQLNELQNLYRQVSRLEQLKTDMIRIATHDLRNPLGIVAGYADLLLDLFEEGSEEKAYIRSMTTAIERMRKITTDILSLERIEQRAQEIVPGHVDLSALVERVYGLYREPGAAKTRAYTLSLPPAALWVCGDEAELREAVGNLIANAITYTPQGGRVAVRLRQEDDRAVFEVEDTGYGIPEEQQARLFSPFFRAQSPETREIEGTGLGLHLVKNIIDRHDGEMRFESVYGKGSLFGFALQLIEEQAEVS